MLDMWITKLKVTLMVYRIEEQPVKKQVRIFKKLVKKCHKHNHITLVDIDDWIFTVPVEILSMGYCVGFTRDETPKIVKSIRTPYGKQTEFLKNYRDFRYLQINGEQAHLYHIYTKVWLYPYYSILNMKTRRTFFEDFWNDYSSISIDLRKEDLEWFMLKIQHLSVVEIRRTSVTRNIIRLVFRMSFWSDSTLVKVERRLKHSQKTQAHGAPKLSAIPYKAIMDNLKYTYRYRISTVEHAEVFNARSKYGGSSIKRVVL